jgi:alpha-glucosidase
MPPLLTTCWSGSESGFSGPASLLFEGRSPTHFLALFFWSSTFFFLYLCYQTFWLRKKMAGRYILAAGAVLCASFTTICAQSSTSAPADATTSFRPIFTVPSDAQNSKPVLPNINDPEAVNAQDVCPGYTASNVTRSPYGFTANLALAGDACNVYGTDVDALSLTVEYQSSDRLHVEITPNHVDSSNSSWYVLPELLVPRPTIDADANSTTLDSDLDFIWSNDPTFQFSVIRQSTGDVLFSTEGTKLVFENQFIEFASSLPENYNLYGLGEVIHGLRMGNNFTRTFYAADVGDPIDYNSPVPFSYR